MYKKEHMISGDFARKKWMSIAFLLIFLASSMYIGRATATISTPKTATFSETLGAFIIIAGARSDNEFESQIMGGSDQVYHTLINHLGFPTDRVYFLGEYGYGADADLNGISTSANIQAAIETWASSRVDSTHGLGLYLFDHGGGDFMCIPGGSLSDTDLNTYLNTLQTSTGCSRNIIVYEACESGSFIGALSKTNRIIITSTDADHSAYATSTWAFFSQSFWGSIAAGNNIGNAFIAGDGNVISSGNGGVQFPLLDDNHDFVGHGPLWVTFPFPWWFPPFGVLPNSGDGVDAMNTIIRGDNAPVPIQYPIIAHIPKSIYIATSVSSQIPIWAVIQNTSTVDHVWARVIPPYWQPPTPPSPDVNGTQIVQDDQSVKLIPLYDQIGTGNYTSNADGKYFGQYNGTYYINFIAQGDGGIGPIVTESATLNQNGTAPVDNTPPMVAITNPQSGAIINDSINITAYGDDAQGLQSLGLFIDGVSVANETMTTYPYPDIEFPLNVTSYSTGVHNITAIATNIAGLTASDTINIGIINPTATNNGIPGYDTYILIGSSIMSIASVYLIKRRKQ